MSFLLPASVPADAARELSLAAVAGGYDNMPGPTQARIEAGQLKLLRDGGESGYMVVPWDVEGAGRVMGATATLIERPTPYHYTVELARGKVNQLRNQAADWKSVGLQMPPVLEEQVRQASLQFGRAITRIPSPDAQREAQRALELGYRAADDLVTAYVDQILRARHQRQPRLDTLLGTRLNAPIPPGAADAVTAAFNSVCVPMAWRAVEPTESQYRWEPVDHALAWAESRGIKAVAGPLVDFSSRGLPDWLWLWEGDLQSLASFMCDYVETAVSRYKGRVRRWHLTAASNAAHVLKLAEDDLLWLTARLAEAALNVDADLELVLGITQPWGEYMAREEQTYSPFIFADTLIRAGLKLAAIDLEWVMGVSPRGSYCRDLMEASRLLDLYAILGAPVQVTLGYPAGPANDTRADPLVKVGAGHWRGGYSPAAQADWAGRFAALAVAKPFVKSVYWTHLTDAEEHHFPHCGLLDSTHAARPALAKLRAVREAHLR